MKDRKLVLFFLLVLLFLLIAPSVYAQITFRFGGGLGIPTSLTNDDEYIVPGSYYPYYSLGAVFNFEGGGSAGIELAGNALLDFHIHLEYVHEFIYNYFSIGPIGALGFNFLFPPDEGFVQGFGLKGGVQLAVVPDKFLRYGLRLYTNVSVGFTDDGVLFYLYFPIYVFLSVSF